MAINAPHLGLEHLQTEDLVELQDEFHFIWKGRLDRVINTGGIKVFPGQIEYKMDALIDARFFIGSQPHEQWGEQVILYVEEEQPNEALISAVRSVPDFQKGEKPKAIYWMKAFKELHTGKVDRLGTQNIPPANTTEL